MCACPILNIFLTNGVICGSVLTLEPLQVSLMICAIVITDIRTDSMVSEPGREELDQQLQMTAVLSADVNNLKVFIGMIVHLAL